MDAQLRDLTESPWLRVRPALEAIAILGAIILLMLVSARPLSRAKGDWILLACGLYYVHHVATDVRRGRTTLQRYGDDPRYDYVRSADPIGFWVLIGMKGAFAVAVVVGALADLTCLWNWS
jgi:hypothetical protein